MAVAVVKMAKMATEDGHVMLMWPPSISSSIYKDLFWKMSNGLEGGLSKMATYKITGHLRWPAASPKSMARAIREE